MSKYWSPEAVFSSAIASAITSNVAVDLFSAVASTTYLLKAANFVNSHATNNTSIEILAATRVIAILNAPALYAGAETIERADGAEITAGNNEKIAIRSTVNTVNVTGTVTVCRKRTPGV